MRVRMLAVLWAALGPAFAEAPPKGAADYDTALNRLPALSEANINQKTEIVRNPGLAVDNAKTALGGIPEASKKGGANLENSPRHIADPTQMTGSFSQALTRIHGKPGGGSGGPASQADVMPQISLAARVARRSSKGVLLSAGGKTHMVKEKGRFTFFENKTLFEVQVDAIENDHVIVTVMPLGQKLTLE